MRLIDEQRLVDQLGLADVASARLLAGAVAAAVTGRPLSAADRESYANAAENSCGQHWREAYLEALLGSAFPAADDDHPEPLTPPSPWKPPKP